MNEQVKDEILADLKEIRWRTECLMGFRKEHIYNLVDGIAEKVFNEDDVSVIFPSDEIPEEPPWVTEFSQLRLDEVMNMTRDDVARDLPPETVAFFL